MIFRMHIICYSSFKCYEKYNNLLKNEFEKFHAYTQTSVENIKKKIPQQ